LLSDLAQTAGQMIHRAAHSGGRTIAFATKHVNRKNWRLQNFGEWRRAILMAQHQEMHVMDSVCHFSRPEIFSFTHAARSELGKRRCLPVDAGTDDRRSCLPRWPLNNINILPSIASGCGGHHAAAIGDPTPLPETYRRLVCAVRTTGSQDSMEIAADFRAKRRSQSGSESIKA
jgi:hypothetical protein